MQILIAEDDAVSRLILRLAVERLGHTCVAASDGTEAWEQFQREGADVVISDWMMPGMDGLELCARVRAAPNASFTHFIMLSALSDRQHFLTGMEAGADDYLTKPLDTAELKARLVVAERLSSLHRELRQKNDELERLNRALQVSVRTDPLTGLGNRLRLREDLSVLQARVERYQHRYVVAMMDVDFFKKYNDRYGHLNGDEALCVVADTIREQIRSGDSAYRYGGEEFLVILAGQTLEAGIVAGERIRQALLDRAVAHADNVGVELLSLSIGIASLSESESPDWQAALAAADAALYRAKADGRNRVAAAAEWPEAQPGSLQSGVA